VRVMIEQVAVRLGTRIYRLLRCIFAAKIRMIQKNRRGAKLFECRTIARLKSKEHSGTWAPDGIEFTSLEIL